MRKITWFVFLVLVACNAAAQSAKQEEVCYNPNLVKDTSKKSIKSMAAALISGDSLKINYHSPGVRNRIIWGGLVPYNEVWVTGAHDATTIETVTLLVINGKEIAPGKYALFTIPGKNEWTVIINKRWKQHLATEYDEQEDIVRVNVKPIKQAFTERLQYFITPAKDGNATIAMAWENLMIEFPVIIKK